MRPSFNTAGPCVPGEHYMLPPERRLGRVLELIADHKFFTLHAGRQTGKTTSALWLVRHLNATGDRRAIWVDIQTAREQPDPAPVMRTVLESIASALQWQRPQDERPDAETMEALLVNPATALLRCLRQLAQADVTPLVVLFDEVDGLVGPAMISFLTQLRQGYVERSVAPFASSVALIGQRQVRDYILTADERRAVAWLGTTSPFNITAEAQTLGPFARDEVAELLAMHTAATGQRFDPEAVERIFTLGCGHPWLTNALADQIVSRDVRDRSIAITAGHVDAAKETIILERRTHIDSLAARLREPRVRRILDPMLAGERLTSDTFDDDLAYVLGLGLVVQRHGMIEIANPIYREVLPRVLTYVQQVSIANESSWYVRPDGSLDMGALLGGFQEFWREDGHLAAEGFSYRESGPHLMLMAFLQRIVNGGGRIDREYGLGRGALDLMIHWRGHRYAIEVKLRRSERTEGQGLVQLTRYLEHAGLDEGWLVLFETRAEIDWTARLLARDVEHAGRRIHVIGC